MAAPQTAGTPPNGAAESPLAAADQSIEEMLNDAIDAQPTEPATEGDAPPDKPDALDAPEPEGVDMTEAAIEKAVATPEGRRAVVKSIRTAQAVNRRKYLSLKGWEGKLQKKSATAKRDVESFTAIRDSFMADVNRATHGTTEEAINALTRIRAGAGQKGEDFLTEAQLTVAKNGKKTIDPKVSELEAKIAKMEKDATDREAAAREGQLSATEQRRLNEIASAVADQPEAFPTCHALAQANRKTLQDLALIYMQNYYAARGEALPETEAAKLVERDYAQLQKYPSTFAYARLGNLQGVVNAVVNLAKTEGLDDVGALSRIEAQLRSHFGATPSGDAGRAPSAQAAPDGQAPMPGKSPSSRAASNGSMREPTKEEALEQFSDLFNALGM